LLLDSVIQKFSFEVFILPPLRLCCRGFDSR